jgi:hypothetical protein
MAEREGSGGRKSKTEKSNKMEANVLVNAEAKLIEDSRRVDIS